MIDNKSPSSEVGRRIKVRRVELGMSQAQLAGEDLSDSYISLLESGRRAPSEGVVEVLAGRLRCSAAWLRSGVNPEQEQADQLRLREAELCLHTGAPERALEIANEISAAGDRPDAMVRVAQNLAGRAHEALGHLTQAIEIFTGEVESAERAGDTPPIEALIALSRCLRESGDIANAIDVAKAGLRRLERDGCPPDEASVELAATLLGAYNERGDLVTGRRLAEQTIAAADQIGSPLARGSAYWNAMLVAVNDGRFTDAERYGDRALALYGETDRARNMGRLKVAYGWLLLRLDPPQPSAALTILEAARSELASTGSRVDQAYVSTEVARAQLLLGQTDAAQESGERARDLLDQTGETAPVEAARVLAVLAMIQMSRGNVSTGKELVAAAASALQDIGASRHAGEVWRELAELAVRAGQADLAIAAFQQALDCVGVSSPVQTSNVPPHAHPNLPASPATSRR